MIRESERQRLEGLARQAAARERYRLLARRYEAAAAKVRPSVVRRICAAVMGSWLFSCARDLLPDARGRRSDPAVVPDRRRMERAYRRLVAYGEHPKPAPRDPRRFEVVGEPPLHPVTLAFRLGARDRSAAERGGDWWLACSLARELAKHGVSTRVLTEADRDERVDVGITVRGRAVTTGRNDGLRVLWLISHPDSVSSDEIRSYDQAFVASFEHAQRLRAETGVQTDVLLQFADPTFLEAMDEIPNTRDLLVVANWRGTYRRIVWDAHCAGLRPTLVGEGWRWLAPEDVLFNAVEHAGLTALYRSARILLVDHWDDMRDAGFVSNKIFDCLACGAFVVSDAVNGLEDLLPGGVVTYRDQRDLANKVATYLADPEARTATASRGRTLVLEHHTVGSRVEQLLDALPVLRRTPPNP